MSIPKTKRIVVECAARAIVPVVVEIPESVSTSSFREAIEQGGNLEERIADVAQGALNRFVQVEPTVIDYPCAYPDTESIPYTADLRDLMDDSGLLTEPKTKVIQVDFLFTDTASVRLEVPEDMSDDELDELLCADEDALRDRVQNRAMDVVTPLSTEFNCTDSREGNLPDVMKLTPAIIEDMKRAGWEGDTSQCLL